MSSREFLMLGGLLSALQKANTNLESLDIDWGMLRSQGTSQEEILGWWKLNNKIVTRRANRLVSEMSKVEAVWVARQKVIDPLVTLRALRSLQDPRVVIAKPRDSAVGDPPAAKSLLMLAFLPAREVFVWAPIDEVACGIRVDEKIPSAVIIDADCTSDDRDSFYGDDNGVNFSVTELDILTFLNSGLTPEFLADKCPDHTEYQFVTAKSLSEVLKDKPRKPRVRKERYGDFE